MPRIPVLIVVIYFVFSHFFSAQAAVLFTTEYVYNDSTSTLVLANNAESPTSTTIQFGGVSPQTLAWDITNSRFQLSSNLLVQGNIQTNGNNLTLDQDNTGGNIILQFGQSIAKTIRWNPITAKFETNGAVDVGGDLSLTGVNFTLDSDTIADQNVQIIAKQAVDPNGILRYNAVENRWEISSDGGINYFPIAISGIPASVTEGGAFISYSTTIEEEFSIKQPDQTSDTQGAGTGGGNGTTHSGMGDTGGWGVYESNNTGCTFVQTPDITNGVVTMTATTANTGCLLMIDDNIRDPRLVVSPGRFPVWISKIQPSHVGPNNILFTGIGDSIDGAVVSPANFIGFTNNGGTTWTGRTTNGGVSSNVTCAGQTISTINPAVIKVDVVSPTSVKFYVDNDATNGVVMTYCGEITTNIPMTNLAPQFEYQTRTGGTAPSYLNVDYFKLYSN